MLKPFGGDLKVGDVILDLPDPALCLINPLP